jgi:hypothetical protein
MNPDFVENLWQIMDFDGIVLKSSIWLAAQFVVPRSGRCCQSRQINKPAASFQKTAQNAT